MKLWHRFLRAMQLSAVGVNCATGAIQFKLHHYGAASVSFGCAVIILALLPWSARVSKRGQAELAELQARHAEMIRILEERVMGPEITAKAQRNLDLVVQALGALRVGPYVFDLQVGSFVFRVSTNTCHKLTPNGCQLDSTCLQGMGLPPAELVASALLLLHNDPTIFDRWGSQTGAYGA